MNPVCDFNKLFVIESLSEGELHTGRHLVDDLVPVVERNGMGLMLWQVASAEQFRSALAQVLQQVRRDTPKTYPILHIDAHGTTERSGIFLSSGAVIKWDEFAWRCREINVSCANNLIVVASMCAGISAVTEVTVKYATPFFALLGPPDTLMPLDAEAMSQFYNKLFETGDIVQSLGTLPHRLELYLAEHLMRNAFAGYIRDNLSTRRRAPRVEKLLTDVLQHPSARSVEIGVLRQKVKRHVQPTEEVYNRWKARFLMADHPNNKGRFSSTFAEAHAAAVAGEDQQRPQV